MSDRNHQDWDGPWQEAGQAVTTSLVILLAGQLGHGFHWSLWYVAGLGFLLSLGTMLWAVARPRRRFRTAIARLVFGLLGTGWTLLAIRDGVFYASPSHRFNEELVPALVVYLVLMVLVCAWMDMRDFDEAAPPTRLLGGPSADEQAIAIAVPNARGCRVVGKEKWANGNGYTIRVELPDDKAVSVSDFDLVARSKLPKQFRLPTGCGVEVSEGENRAEVVLRVQTRDGLARPRDYSLDLPSPSTLREATPLGWTRTGSLVEASFFPHHGAQRAFLWGNTGSGKSTALNVLIASWVRTRDTVVWVIDPSVKQGQDFRAWVDLYLEGRTQTPAIDWLAVGEAEANRMLDAALRIAADRLRGHRTRKITPSWRTPALVVLMDEAATYLGSTGGNPAITRKWVQLIKESRAAGIVLVTSCLRAVGSEYADQNVKVQAGIRIGLQVTQASESQWGFDNRSLDLRTMVHIGMGAVMENNADPVVYRGWDMRDGQAEEIAVAVDQTHAPLEQVSVDAAGQDYATRWERTRRALDGELEPVVVAPAQTTGTLSRAAALLEQVERARTAQPADFLAGIDPDSFAELEALEVRAEGGSVALASPTAGAQLLADLLRAIPDGSSGIWTEEATELLGARYPGLDAKTLAQVVRPFGLRPVDIKSDGQVRKGYRREHIQAALHKIR